MFCIRLFMVNFAQFVTGILLLFLLSYSQNVNAQLGNLSKIIEDKFTKESGAGYHNPPELVLFVHPVYESPTTILIQGDLIVEKEVVVNPTGAASVLQKQNVLNTDLWSAMDLLKDQYGFKIQQIMTSGVGSEGNPTTVYILMTK